MAYVVWFNLTGVDVDRPYRFGPFQSVEEAVRFLESKGLVNIGPNWYHMSVATPFHQQWRFTVKEDWKRTGRYWYVDRWPDDYYQRCVQIGMVASPSQIPPSWFETPLAPEGVAWRQYNDADDDY